MEPNSPLLVSPEAVAQSLERSAMQSASQDAGGMRGIGRALVEGVADNTPLGRVFLRPLNSITTETERAQQFQKSEQLVRLYQQAAALRALPMQAERDRLALETDKLQKTASEQRIEINAKALQAADLDIASKKTSNAHAVDAAERDIIADAETAAYRRAKSDISTAISDFETRTQTGPDGKPVDSPLYKLTNEDRRLLEDAAPLERIHDIYTIEHLWMTRQYDAAIRYARSRGANITQTNGDQLVIKSLDGQDHVVTIELFDSVKADAQKIASEEIGARFRMIQASKSFGHALMAKTMQRLMDNGYAKGALEAEEMVKPLFANLTPPAIESLADQEAMERLVSPSSTTIQKEEAMAWLAPLQQALGRASIEVIPTKDGQAVLVNTKTGHAETLSNYVSAMAQANDTIQQVNAFLASVDANQKAMKAQAAQDRKTKREETVEVIPGESGYAPEITTQQALLERAQAGATKSEPAGTGQMSADQLFDSLGIPKAKGRK